MSSPRPTAPPRQRSGPLLAVVIGAVVVVAAIVAVVVANRGSDGSNDAAPNDQQTRPVQVAGTALPRLADSGADPAIGTKAPALTGQSFDGSPVVVTPGQRPTLLVFVAHWCPHCRAEVPRLVQWLTSPQTPSGLDVVAVSTGV